MYIDDISIQINVFLYSLGFGFFLGLIYDIFRLTGTIIKRNKTVFLQDILYFLLCSLLTFFFLLVVNNGKFRINILIALVSGFYIYYLTLSKSILNFFINFIRSIRSIIVSVSRVLTIPIRLILDIFVKSNRKTHKKLKNIEISRKKAIKPLENKE